MSDLSKMKETLERFRILKQAKDELDKELFEQFCQEINIEVKESKPKLNSSKQEKLTEFLNNLDANLIKLFKEKTGEWHINTQRSNRLEFVVDIDKDSEIDKLARIAVENIGKSRIKIDSKDGEYTFVYMFNPIFEYLGFEKRFYVDDKRYEGMGDNGDFKYGMNRLDIKLRQREKANHRWDLWVNEKDANAGYTEFILMRRDGDNDKIGEQRRITVAGFATAKQLKSGNAQIRNRREKTLKYEVEEKYMCDLRELIKLILEKTLEYEE